MIEWPLFHSYDLSFLLIFTGGAMLVVGIRLRGLILARRTRKPVSQTAIWNAASTISVAPTVLLLTVLWLLEHAHLPVATITRINAVILK